MRPLRFFAAAAAAREDVDLLGLVTHSTFSVPVIRTGGSPAHRMVRKRPQDASGTPLRCSFSRHDRVDPIGVDPIGVIPIASFRSAPRAEREPPHHDECEQHEGRHDAGLRRRQLGDGGDHGHHREHREQAEQHLESVPARNLPHDLTPPAVRPEMMRRWKISTITTSGTMTSVPPAMIDAYGVTYGSVPVNRAIATVTGAVLSLDSCDVSRYSLTVA